jgi:putative transposase
MPRKGFHMTRFTSWAFIGHARNSGLVPSMGSIGDCYDNVMIEAFWSRMQVGSTRAAGTRVEFANAIFEYIDIFHNADGATRVSACRHHRGRSMLP